MNGKSSMRMGGHNNRKPYRMKRFPDYKKAYVKLGPGRADAPTRSKVTRPPCLHPCVSLLGSRPPFPGPRITNHP